MAVISIIYSEGNKKNIDYKSVDISYSFLKKKKKFNTGDFERDWYDCMKFIIHSNISDREFVIHSSSVNHFIMDGAPYTSAYLHVIDGKGLLKYINESNRQLGIEFFVKDGTQPTWDELRKLCGDEKLPGSASPQKVKSPLKAKSKIKSKTK